MEKKSTTKNYAKQEQASLEENMSTQDYITMRKREEMERDALRLKPHYSRKTIKETIQRNIAQAQKPGQDTKKT